MSKQNSIANFGDEKKGSTHDVHLSRRGSLLRNPQRSSNEKINQDVNFKMSKKIAQLTKVIFMLNTKADNFELERKSTIESYEMEIEMLLQSARNHISSLNKSIALKEGENTLLNGKFKSKEEEFEKFKRDQSNAIKEQSIRELELKEKEEENLSLKEENSKIKNELTSMKKQSAENKRMNDEIKAREDDLMKQISQKNDAMSDMTRMHRNQLEIMKKQYKDQESIFQSDIEKLNSLINENDKKLEEVYKREQETNELHLQKLTNAKIEIEEKSEALKRVEEDLQLKSVQLESSNEKIEVLQQKNRKLFMDFRKMTEKAQNAETQCQSLQEELDRTKDTCENSATIIKNLEEKCNRSREDITNKSIELSTLRKLFEELQGENERMANNISQMKSEAEIHVKQIETLELKITHLHEYYREKLDTEQKTLTLKMMTLYDKMQRELNSKIKSMETEHKNTVTNLQTEITAGQVERQRIEEENEHQREKISKDHEQQIEALKQKCNSQILKYKNMATKIQKEKEHFEEYSLELTKNLQFANDNINDVKQQLEIMERKYWDTTQEKEDMIQQIMLRDKQYKEQADKMVSEAKQQLDAVWRMRAEQNENEIRNSLTANHTQEMLTLIKELKQKAKEETDELNRLHTEEINKCKKEIEDLEKKIEQFEQEKIQSQEFIEKLEHEARESLNLLNEKHEQDLKLLQGDMEKQLKANQKKYRLMSVAAISKAEKSHATKIEELNTKFAQEKDELRKFHLMATLALKQEGDAEKQNEIKKLRENLENQMKQQEERHFKEVSEKIISFNVMKVKEIRELNDKHMAEMSAKTKEIEALEKTLEEKEIMIENLQGQVNEFKQEVVNMEFQLENINQENENMMRQKEEEMKNQSLELSSIHEKEIENLTTSHLEENKVMLKDFEVAQGFMRKQIKQLTEQLEEADRKYKNREAREVDMLKIAELGNEIKDREDKIAGISRELEYYRRELSNREENFNKIFNKQPQVGIMKPLDYVKKKSLKGSMDNYSKLPPLYGGTVSLPDVNKAVLDVPATGI